MVSLELSNSYTCTLDSAHLRLTHMPAMADVPREDILVSPSSSTTHKDKQKQQKAIWLQNEKKKIERTLITTEIGGLEMLPCPCTVAYMSDIHR